MTWFQESSEMWNEAVDAAQIHEGAEVHDGGNGALETHTALELGEDLGALGLAGLLEHHATGEHDVIAVAIHLDDASLDRGAEVGGEILHAAKVNEGSGQEAAQADVEDKTALDDLDDLALDVLAGVELLLDAIPGTLVLGALLGENQTTVLVLLLEHERLDGVAQRHEAAGLASLRMESSRTGMTPSDLKPMSTRTSSRSIFTTVPLTRSPSSKSVMELSMRLFISSVSTSSREKMDEF